MPQNRDKEGLTPKEVRFCEEYPLDLNATQAAIRAGYAPKHAKATGSRLLTLAPVQAALSERVKARADAAGLRAEDVLRELMRLAFVDLGKAYAENGTLLPIHEIPEDVRRAMVGIEVDEIWEGYGEERTQTGVTRKVKFADKNRALELLGKNLKLFVDRVEHTADSSFAAALKAARERVAKR